MDMGKALVKIKIMPESPEVNLKLIEEEAKKVVKKIAGTEAKTEEEPIAFGLNAVILQFMIDESIPLEGIEEKLKGIPSVSSIDIIDFRRAFG
jgi:translation elongation factor aEF-1 beta